MKQENHIKKNGSKWILKIINSGDFYTEYVLGSYKEARRKLKLYNNLNLLALEVEKSGSFDILRFSNLVLNSGMSIHTMPMAMDVQI